MIETEDADGVRLIAFNRPEARNAFNVAMYRAVADALEEAGGDDTVHAVVLTGRGSAFSAGQDLREMAEIAGGRAPADTGEGFPRLLDSLHGCPTPLFAAVNGVGVGLGFTMLAHCDIVLIDEGARLRVPFAELGVPPEAGSSYLFPARMGWQQAARVLLCSEWVNAQEAVDSGIALGVCPSGTVVDQSMALAKRVAAYPPEAVREIKALMRAAQDDAVGNARSRENEAYGRLLGSAATREALDRWGTT
ncbi:MAG TPA: enoyl-CoA hydratase-related protein [Acidimicrobiales bacterium]|nr:enoyl-CoA hydratase-related protein [Acidimicrobiales bacterium]